MNVQLIEKELKESLHFGFLNYKKYRDNHLTPQLLLNDESKGVSVLTTLQEELSQSISFKISVAFVTQAGINMIKSQLIDLASRGISGQLLISPYLGFNDPRTMRELLKLKNVQVRLAPEDLNLHSKFYLFQKDDYQSMIIGSSNLTLQAMKKNYEWNVQLNSLEHGELVKESHERFDDIWENSQILTTDLIDQYAGSRKFKTFIQQVSIETKPAPYEERITPNQMQEEALASIHSLRLAGAQRALVVSATGTGKTYLSAFDVKEFKPRKFLFLVHREQILTQAFTDYQRVLNFQDGEACIYQSGQNIADKRYVFATIQSLSRDENLQHLSAGLFDYILIDEVHRAGANSYSKILHHFEPDFLLGMTATPERTDNVNIYELFDYNIAYEIRLQQALKEDMLCPFQYFGVSEYLVDGELIDDREAFTALTSDERVSHILEKVDYYGVSGESVKGLVFCSNRKEASELSALFNERGRKTLALTGADSQKKREAAIQELEAGHLEYIFTVDIFNEGVDIPSINQIVMLRNTESSIVFVQQLGRGLRKAPDKEFLTVIDFIGNYRNNYLIPIALFGDHTMNKDNYRRHMINKNELPGLTMVNFERIAEEKIFESITSTRLASMKTKREAYFDLRQKLGRIPLLSDFKRTDSIDPEVFFDKNFQHYGEVIERFEKGLLLDLSPYQEAVLILLSNELLNGKRPHELLLLQLLIKHQGRYSRQAYETYLNNEGIYSDSDVIRSVERFLTLEFFVARDRKKYGNKFLKIEGNDYSLSSAIYRDTNEWFWKLLQDAIATGLTNTTAYPAGRTKEKLEIGQKYSRKDAMRLLLWDNDESSTLYGYKTKYQTTPIFVTYHKSDEISETTMYGDEFINKGRFHWYTRSQRTLKSKEVLEIINSNHHQTTNYLFVKKDDGEGSDFYYLGEVKVDEDSIQQETMISKDKEVPVVTMDFELENPAPYNLYHYFTKE